MKTPKTPETVETPAPDWRANARRKAIALMTESAGMCSRYNKLIQYGLELRFAVRDAERHLEAMRRNALIPRRPGEPVIDLVARAERDLSELREQLADVVEQQAGSTNPLTQRLGFEARTIAANLKIVRDI